MAFLKSFLFILALLAFASAAAAASRPIIREFPKQSLLRAVGGADSKCESWKFSFEANNLRSRTVPKECIKFVVSYMVDNGSNSRYFYDLSYVVDSANEFAATVNLKGDGKDAWIFDIDDTLLSNVLYFLESGYGWESFNETDFNEWLEKGLSYPIFYNLFLYKGLQIAGFKAIILTERDESTRSSTENILLRNSYTDWEKLIMRGPEDQGKEVSVFKSEKIAELVEEGYRLHGNVGDQWRDLLGSPSTTRTFKIPNPMYYLP